jgi:hypothetical protein
MTRVDTIGTTGRVRIDLPEWQTLSPAEVSELMARDVYPAVELEVGPAGAGRLVTATIRPRAVHAIKGMGGKLYDFRRTGLLSPSGGRIRILVGVEHIPVVRNVPGLGDFFTLANVLKAQGLALQRSTDSEGNVCAYTDLNELCFQARGVNAISYGVEHMHLTIGEAWRERQFRAAALVMAQAFKTQGLSLHGGKLVHQSPGIAGCTRTGHVSHKYVSAAAGFNDRSDPGPGFRFGHCYDLARFYLHHHRF